MIRPLLSLLAVLCAGLSVHGKIDRRALVQRHNPIKTSALDLLYAPNSTPGSPHHEGNTERHTPFQVGNGHFAFSLDLTGLQSFIPCNTLSDWAWHRAPLPKGCTLEDYQWTLFDSDHGRKIPFPYVGLANDNAYKSAQITLSEKQRQMAEYLRANPHRLNLGRLSMRLVHKDGRLGTLEDLKEIRQELDLWTGLVTSHFVFEGLPVDVLTACHRTRDQLGIRIHSPLLAEGRLQVGLAFPYGDSRGFTPEVGDWNRAEAHSTFRVERGIQNGTTRGSLSLLRVLDKTRTCVQLAWGGDAAKHAELTRPTEHEFVLKCTAGTTLEISCEFAGEKGDTAQDSSKQATAEQALSEVDTITHSSTEGWARFWNSGAAIDFSGSKDPRAQELERRVILSQYLLRVQEAGSLPPQEAGLVNNGWYGKFHLEMFWWHAAHYALWNRWEELSPSLRFYAKQLPEARALARRQGFEGARWPKMVGPDGLQSPSSISPFLIWQQPHPLFFAELDYRHSPAEETLKRWSEVVFATADFMADLPVWDPLRKIYSLGAPLKTVPENTAPETTRNPAFELSYWRFGLRIASDWRKRMGLPAVEKWDRVANALAPLPRNQGVYVFSETQPDTFENFPWEHPSLLGPLGLLPGDGVDPATMKATLSKVLSHWKMDRVWGWDFPLMAMTAARLGEQEKALDLLLTASPNFQFASNGLATGGPWPYFPSNGGLLYAIALMAGGWDGPGGDAPLPGFPKNGLWQIEAEGFSKAP